MWKIWNGTSIIDWQNVHLQTWTENGYLLFVKMLQYLMTKQYDLVIFLIFLSEGIIFEILVNNIFQNHRISKIVLTCQLKFINENFYVDIHWWILAIKGKSYKQAMRRWDVNLNCVSYFCHRLV